MVIQYFKVLEFHFEYQIAESLELRSPLRKLQYLFCKTRPERSVAVYRVVIYQAPLPQTMTDSIKTITDSNRFLKSHRGA